MPIELEVKLKVAELAPIREKLTHLGAVRVGRYLESNIFFDTEDRTLLAGDQGLRLRISTDMLTNKRELTLTHKGPRLHGSMKMREETEVGVDNADPAIHLLERLGFLRLLSFEKKRESWKIDGCKVELDELPFLGAYVEIEGPREELIRVVQEKVGLGDRPMVKASYVALLKTHLQERGDPRQVVAFSSDGGSGDDGGEGASMGH